MSRQGLLSIAALLALCFMPRASAFVPSMPMQRGAALRETARRVLHENEVPLQDDTGANKKNMWSGMVWNEETEQWEKGLDVTEDEQVKLDAASLPHVQEVHLEHSKPMSAQESVLLYLQKAVDATNETPDEVSM